MAHPVLTRRTLVTAAAAMLVALSLGACQSWFRSKPTDIEPSVADDGEPRMRVRIARETSEARFESEGPLFVAIYPSAARPDRLRGPVTVRLTESGWVATDGSGDRKLFERSRPLTVRTVDGADIGFDGGRYPGSVFLHARDEVSRGVFDVVDHVPLERYLPGVVAKELYPNWSLGAYEAQAIAARSYAMHERRRRTAKGDHFDIESTVRDQVYGGLTENATALRAVANTRGQVLMHRGHVLRAYYSSTCGGRPGSARDTWPTSRGYEYNLASPIQAHAREHACQPSPLYSWTITRNADELARRFAAWGASEGSALRNVRSVARIEPTRTNDVGRNVEYRVYDREGKWWSLSAEQVRNASNHKATGLTDIVRETRIHSGDFAARIENGQVVFTGRGFGHGVGMCQFCAEGWSKAGVPAREILTRFYPGATLEKAY